MEVRIQTHLAAENFLAYNPNKWDVICITNSDQLTPVDIRRNAARLLNLIFDDIDYPLGSFIMPSSIDVNMALDFSRYKERLLVTCYGGISRSAAIAYVCKCQECSPDELILMLTPLRHHPNRKVISIAANLLNKPEIYNVYNKWMQKPYFYHE